MHKNRITLSCAGNNLDIGQQYVFNDNKPNQGVNYYRLKEIDKSGKFTYSKIVSVELDNTEVQYILYPNPAKYKSTIQYLQT